MNIFIRLFIILIIILFQFDNCTEKAKKGPYIIAYSQYGSIEPIRISMNNSILREAKNYPEIEKIEFADAQCDPIQQKKDIEKFLQMDVDLLIVIPGEEEIILNTVKRVYNSGIPVIILDKAFADNYYTCFIGIDNTEIGKKAGEYAVKMLNEEGNIVEIQGLPGTYNSVERAKGFRQIIDKYPGINIIYSNFADWNTPLTITKMEAALRNHKKIDLVYAHNTDMALGAFYASRSHEREGGMIFIGIGDTSEGNIGIQAILDRKINALFSYPTYGKEAVETALNIFKGKKIPKIIKLKTELITIDNVENYLK